MMIPQVAARLIATYGSPATTLFDPYCGTGTSLVEGNLHHLDAIGTDLNPLARLIAQAKTTPLHLPALDACLKDFADEMFAAMFDIRRVNVAVPTIENLDYWFDKPIQEKLAYLKNFIDQLTDPAIANFFKVAFSETVRACSWTRNSEFKMFRMTAEQIKKFQPDVFGVMQSKLARNRRGLQAFMEQRRDHVSARVYDFNTVKGIPSEIIPPQSIDLVVTSPPYGDSKTTVAYGQFSRLSNEWLGLASARQIDRQLMGGDAAKEIKDFDCAVLNQAIAEIATKDDPRAKEVVAFYEDYRHSIAHVAPVVKAGGVVCYVVGNRRVKGVPLPTDEITQKFFEPHGFAHIETIIRHIPNKRMPSRNSPTNVVGAQDSTMCYEYIVVLRKNL